MSVKKKFYQTRQFKRSVPLWVMFLPVVLYYVIFHFLPMFGIVIAFQNYRIRDGILGSRFVGMKYFKMIFTDTACRNVIRNTFALGVTRFLIGIPFPIILAIVINEIKNKPFKKITQTIVYLPHFLAWTVVGGMVLNLFSQDTGIINKITELITGSTYPYLYHKSSWLFIYFGSGIWKEAGFAAIIYLAALSGVDSELFNAAAIDGASRIKQIFHVTFPVLIPTIIVNMILSIGGVFNVGFDQIYTLSNATVRNISDVISTYVYRAGLQQMQLSLTTALGLFQSLLGMILIIFTNRLARRSESNLW